MANERTKIFCGLVEDYNKDKAKQKEYNVAGYVHPLRPHMTAKGYMPEGTTVHEAIKKACKDAGVRECFMKRGVAQIGTRDIKNGVTIWRPCTQIHWKERKLQQGELLRFRLLPQGGGGGGGKNPLRVILTVVVAVVAVVGSVFLGPEVGAALFAGLESATALGMGLVGLAISTIGMVLVNAIAPVKPPSFGGLGSRREMERSNVYGINAGRNALNQWGRVPVPLGYGRFAPPKAASPFTINHGDDQYLHELLCVGIGDVDISEIKIGTTPIEDFVGVQYEYFKYDPSKKNKSELYPTGVFQEDLNVKLTSGVWNTRTTTECDYAQCDIGFQGLGYFNDDGGIDGRSVRFLVQYKNQDSLADWKDVPPLVWANGANLVVSSIPAQTVDGVVAITLNGQVNVFWNGDNVPEGYYILRKIRGQIGEINKVIYGGAPMSIGQFISLKSFKRAKVNCVDIFFRDGGVDAGITTTGLNVYINPAYFEAKSRQVWREDSEGRERISWETYYDAHDATIQVSGGYVSEANPSTGFADITYSGATSSLLRKTFQIKFPKRGVYNVRWLRITEDSSSDRLRTDSFWTALKSLSTDLPVNTPYPVNLLAIKVKASGQLSGALENVTVFYRTKILDWDRETKTWIKRYSSNPASLYRHVLQDSLAMARPQPDDVIDLPMIQEAHEFWDDKGWEFNLVCDAATSVFERIQSFCASGLASPTMVDGKWSIIIDKPRSHVVCAFTSANAWSWSFKRTQVRLPNEIHCNFISDVTWDSIERRVATDEPVKDQVIFETQSYEGVNNPAQIYQLARFHYADAKVRRRTISFRCYDEALLCTRGDLVECACPNVSPQGLQVGRVRKVIRDENNQITEIITDQTQSTDFSGRRFGVRIYAKDGSIFHAEIKPENRTNNRLVFYSPQEMDISAGDKYAFGDYSEEVFQAIVLAMKFNTDWTCDVILQDYTPQIYGDLSQPIPPFESIITVPIDAKFKLTSIPIIRSVITDESVLIKNGNVSTPRMLVKLAHPSALDDRAKYLSLDYSEAGKNEWVNVVRIQPLDELDIYAEGVIEKKLYDVRVRYVSDAGFVGEYAYLKNVYIEGRTNPPSPPDSLLLDGYNLIIQHKNRTLDVVGYVVYMTFDEDDPFEWALQLSEPYTVSMSFNLTPWAGQARRVWVRTIDELGLLSEPRSVVVNLGDVIPDNVLIHFSEKERDWSGTIINGYTSMQDLFSEELAYLYPQQDEDYLFQQKDDFALYPSGTAKMMQYTWSVELLSQYGGASVKVFNDFVSGKLLKLEYRNYTERPLFTQDDAAPLFVQDDTTHLFPQPNITEWKPFPSNYITPGGETLEFRATYSDSVLTHLDDIQTIIDVPDKDWAVNDLTIPLDGVLIPIPEDTFRKITNISFGLQDVGTDAAYARYIPFTETEDLSTGFLVTGPLVYVTNKDGQRTTGSVDIRMKGY